MAVGARRGRRRPSARRGAPGRRSARCARPARVAPMKATSWPTSTSRMEQQRVQAHGRRCGASYVPALAVASVPRRAGRPTRADAPRVSAWSTTRWRRRPRRRRPSADRAQRGSGAPGAPVELRPHTRSSLRSAAYGVSCRARGGGTAQRRATPSRYGRRSAADSPQPHPAHQTRHDSRQWVPRSPRFVRGRLGR